VSLKSTSRVVRQDKNEAYFYNTNACLF
jgi:hypothetical protein